MPTILDFPQEDLYTKVQNLTRQLQFSDNGRHLKCVATHPALEKSSVTMSQLDVLCKLELSRIKLGFIKIFQFKLRRSTVTSGESHR